MQGFVKILVLPQANEPPKKNPILYRWNIGASKNTVTYFLRRDIFTSDRMGFFFGGYFACSKIRIYLILSTIWSYKSRSQCS